MDSRMQISATCKFRNFLFKKNRRWFLVTGTAFIIGVCFYAVNTVWCLLWERLVVWRKEGVGIVSVECYRKVCWRNGSWTIIFGVRELHHSIKGTFADWSTTDRRKHWGWANWNKNPKAWRRIQTETDGCAKNCVKCKWKRRHDPSLIYDS